MKEFNNKNKSQNRYFSEVDFQEKASKLDLAPKIIDYSKVKPYSIVMEKMSMTLPELIKKQNGKLTENQQKDLIKLHKKLDDLNIYHNDPNPLNIMVTKSGQFKFIDFGFSKNITGSTKPNPNIRSLKTLFFGGMQGIINTTSIEKKDIEIIVNYFIENKIYTKKELDKLK